MRYDFVERFMKARLPVPQDFSFSDAFPLGTVAVTGGKSPSATYLIGAGQMHKDALHFPADHQWVHRGELPSLTMPQARLALAVCLLHTPECVSLATEAPIMARLDLSSGRSAVLRPELINLPGGIGLRMTVDGIHEQDVQEVTRIHESIVANYPVIACAIQAANVAEVA